MDLALVQNFSIRRANGREAPFAHGIPIIIPLKNSGAHFALFSRIE
jgi:hypothetical protein